MLDEIKDNDELSVEYEKAFDNEEKVSHALKITNDAFSIDVGIVELDSLLIPDPISKSRHETIQGLTTSVAELGIVTPIHVMITEGYALWKENGGEEEYEGYKYALIDGLRRIYAGFRNKLSRCYAVIWDFKDKDKGNEICLMLSRVLNRSQKHSWEETWKLYNILMAQSTLTDNTADYLLQLDMGDSAKLKAIMDSKGLFPDPYNDLISNKKSLQQAYSMLEKQRKEIDQVSRDDLTGISDTEPAEGVVEKYDDSGTLSDEEVKEILDIGKSFDGELTEEDFDELAGNNIPDDRQNVGERHPLDPALRAAVLARDGYCCAVTGRGKGLPMPIALSILNVHHLVPVHAGGTDTMDNLITLSLDLHTLVHILERNNGKIGMSKEDFDKLSEEDQKFIMGAMKIARVAIEANKRLGRTKEQVRKDTSDAVKFKMPGVVQKENMEAVAANRG